MLHIAHFADRTSALHCGVNALHYGLVLGQSRSKMADDAERGFENWKVSDLRGFLLARDLPVCDQAKAVLVQNCYLVVSLELQPKKPLDEYAQDICQTKQGKLMLDGGMIRLPDPDTLTEGWEDSPSSLPNIVQNATKNYFDKSKWKNILLGSM